MTITAGTRPRAGTFAGVVGFLVIMELGSGMLQGWYPPLLSAMGAEFKVDAAQLNWVSAGYLLATVVFVPVIGKLGDRYGHKRLLTICAAMVALGSAVVALAPNFAVLLLGRALQAPLAGFLPLEFAIVNNRDEKSAGRSIGKLVGALTFGGAIGALGAGLLYNALGNLRLVLWMPALFLLACVPVVAFLVPESTVRASGRIDWAGAALLGTGLLVTLGGISNAANWGWGNPLLWVVLVVGIALLYGWVKLEQRVPNPLVDLSMLRRGIGLPLIMAILFGAQMFGSQTASSLFMLSNPAKVGFGLGVSPAVVGLISLFTALAAFVAATLGDRLAGRVGSKTALAIGGLLLTVFYVGLILGSSSLPIFVAAMILGGLGNGIVISVLPTVVVKRAPRDSVGIASALYNTSRTAAGAVAGAVFALVMGSFLTTVGTGGTATRTTAYAGYVAVWIICAVVSAAIVALAPRVGDPRQREPLTTAGVQEPATAGEPS